MIEADQLDKLLLRQMRKVGITDPLHPPDPETWARFVARVSEHYRKVEEDRVMLTRSLELATHEMEGSSATTHQEHGSLKSAVRALSEALDVMRRATTRELGGETIAEISSAVSGARSQLAARLDQLVPQSHTTGELVSDFRSIREHFGVVSDRFLDLLRRQLDSESIVAEVEVARTVQHMLLPESQLFERPFLQLAAFFQPASRCGGDWWTAHDLPDGRFLVIVGDVTGHGVASAIITGAAKAACDLVRGVRGEHLAVEELLTLVNRAIESAARRHLLMTMVAAIVDPHRRQLTLANAGHKLPYLVRTTPTERLVQPVWAHGAPLGATRDTVFTPVTVNLQPGDVLYFGTDGVTECESLQGEQFSDKRLKAVLQHAAQWDAVGVRDSLQHALSRFAAGGALKDDVTFVVAKIRD